MTAASVTPINAAAAAAAAQAAQQTGSQATQQANIAAWGTSGNGYDPDRFYTAGRMPASSQTPGQYDHLRIKIQPWVTPLVQGIINSRDIPAYHSVDDFIRDAIIHRLHYLEDNKGTADFKRKIRTEQELWDQEQAILDAERIMADLEDKTTRIESLFERYTARRMWSTLRKQIDEHRDKSDGWENGDLRDQVLALCNEYEKKIPADILF